MELITADEARGLQKTYDNSEAEIKRIDTLIKLAIKRENSMIEVCISGPYTRQIVIQKLRLAGYDVVELVGPSIHIKW